MIKLIDYIKNPENNHKIMYFSDYYNSESLKFGSDSNNTKPCKVQFFKSVELEGCGIPIYFTDLVMVFLDENDNITRKCKFHHNSTSEIFDTLEEATIHYNKCIDEFIELMDIKCNKFINDLLNSKLKV